MTQRGNHTDASPEAVSTQTDTYRAIFNATNEAIFVHDPTTGRILDVNDTMLDMYRVTYAEAVRSAPSDFSAASDAFSGEHALELIKKAANGDSQMFEWQARRSDGKRFWVEVTLKAAVLNAHKRVLAVVRDISDRRAIEDALEHVQDLSEALLEQMTDVVWVLEPDGTITYETPSASRALGYPHGYFEGKNGFAFIHPDDLDLVQEDLADVVATGGDMVPTEFRVRHGDGHWVTFEALGRNLLGHPRIRGLVITARDISGRKAIEEEMRSFKIVADEANYGMAIAHLDGTFKYVNREFADAHGFSPEDLMGTALLARHTPQQRERVEKLLDHLHKNGQFRNETVWHTHRDGHAFPMLTNAVLVRDPKGEPLFLAATTIAIGDRMLTEEALRDSERKFRTIVDSSIMGMHLYHLRDDGTLIFEGANPAADRLLGVANADFIGLEIENAFPALAGTDVPKHYREIALHGGQWETEQIEYEDRHIAGAFEVMAFQTEPRHMVAMFADVTERKRVDAELESVRQLLMAAIEESPAGVLIADAPDARIRIANSAALDIRGPSEGPLTDIPAELHPANWQTFYPDGRPCAPEDLPLTKAVLQGLTTRNEQLTIRRDDGGDRLVLANAAPVKDARGKITAGVVVFMDITDLRKAETERLRLENQIQHAQKLESLGILAGGIAHDFNNLLCAILGSADLALMELAKGHPARTDLTMVRETAQQATELCLQMLAYSGRGRFVVEPLCFNDLVQNMSHLLEVSTSKKVTLRHDLRKDLPSVEADVAQMRQVLLNLVVNASEAIGEESGTVTVSTGSMMCDRNYLKSTYLDEGQDEGLYTYIEVADTGCGMDAEAQTRLFDPFFTTKFAGRGLGLAATLGIVRSHKGAIKVYSEPTSGSCFRVFLPASTAAAKPVRADEPITSWSGHGHLLLVDDEPSVRAVGKRILERLGFDVSTAEDGQAGVDAYRSAPDTFDLVILDMTMPRMNGEEAFHALRRLNPDVCVILTSGYNEKDATHRFEGKGLAAFIQKPFQMEVMRRTLKDVTQRT